MPKTTPFFATYDSYIFIVYSFRFRVQYFSTFFSSPLSAGCRSPTSHDAKPLPLVSLPLSTTPNLYLFAHLVFAAACLCRCYTVSFSTLSQFLSLSHAFVSAFLGCVVYCVSVWDFDLGCVTVCDFCLF
jgi:hypothetical protein